MEPLLVRTVTGTGDDGKAYTIHGYKRMRRQGDQWVKEELISLIQTDEGEEVYCYSEDPLVFRNLKTQMKIRCD